MALNFPNPSRSYDEARHVVRFWGYDGAQEISFIVSEAALKALRPNLTRGTDDLLDTFDANRARIYAAADKLSKRGQKSWYEILAADL